MDLRNKINEAIENGDIKTADILTQKLYEAEFGEDNIQYDDSFADNIIASSKGEKIKMNNKLKKLVVAASCTLIIGVTGFTVNAANNGEIVNNAKTFIKIIEGVNVEAKQYNDENGTNTEYEIYNFEVKETELKNGDVNVTIDDKDSNASETK